jgi:RNA polymerase sigma factor (TIGR02999 family)
MDESPKELSDVVYGELYALARQQLQGERRNHTLQPTALVNEAYVCMANYGESVWGSRGRFRAVAATCIRHILVQHARRRGAEKRGGGVPMVSLVDIGVEPSAPLVFDVLELEDVLDELKDRDEQAARLVELRYFGGLTVDECSEEVGISVSAIKEKFRFGLAWLRMRIGTPEAE